MRSRWFILLSLFAATLFVLGSRERREEAVELVKDASDVLISGTLQVTSEFGRELTDERQAEQPAFRRRRLRDLH